MRKFFLSALMVMIFASLAWGDASLYRGANSIGAVATIEAGTNFLVAVEDVGKLFGFTASKNGEELTLSRGNTQLRIIANSAAAWRGFTLVPLFSSPVERDGKFWVDTQSAIAIFQPSAGSGANNRLRFSRTSGNVMKSAISDISKSDLEFGRFETKPQNPAPAPAPAIQIPAPAPVIANNPVTMPAAPQSNSGTPANFPKHEIFRPDSSSNPRNPTYNGEIKLLRWSAQEGSHKKIRAVVDVVENSNPQVYLQRGVIHALFASAPANIEGVSSPYVNVRTEISRTGSGIDLAFASEGFVKIEKLILDNPRRIVFDFFFPEQMQIVKNSSPQPANNVTVAANPVQIPVVTPQKPVQREPVKIPVTTPAKNPKQPTITIPMTPAPAKPAQPAMPVITLPSQTQTRRIAGKKTVVIDAGHGGKDPGASANGVTEKNINLAVALALEKELLARGFHVIMTRRTDIYLKLQERTDIANNMHADLFVSVHINALPSKKSMSGFEIYIMALPTDKDAMNLAKVENREYVEGKGVDVANVDRRTEMLLRILGDMQQNNKISESTEFASALHKAGVKNGLPMRRVAQAPFFVLRGAGMPAVLLELGFVTNAIEAKLLTRPDYQQKIAQAMTEGIINYLQ